MSDPTEPWNAEQTVAVDSESPGAPLKLPARLGDYVLTELLGQGGMGRVYKADQLEPVRREVAIKVLAADLVDAELLIRFDAERQALARMSHPNIAQVYDAGKSAAGQPYLIMEYAPGLTLIDYCNKRELGLESRLRLFQDICSALAHAHQKGIIHRDIKPANILVTEQDGKATPKVIDFGLAKALVGDLADRSLHTHAGTVLGTPAYMSPEQASLTGEAVDTRTDIYALGLVLYQLTTGTLPFRRIGERNSTIEQVLRAVREDEPTRPSLRVASQGAGELPPGLDIGIGKALREDLDWIILKCLAKKPEDRYQSANELLADIERYGNHEPVQARRSTIAYLIAKGARRYRIPLMVAAVVLELGGVLGGGWLNSRAKGEAQARAAQQFGQTVERMDSMLRVAHLIPAHDISPVRERIKTTITELEARLDGMQEWSSGPAQYAIGRGLLSLDNPRDALDHLKLAWATGYREPSVAYALGLAYGRVYEKQQQAIRLVTNPERHAQLLQQAQSRYRDPAIEFLRRGADAGARSTDYGKALIALYEKKFEQARTLAEQAIKNNPWLYEAVVLIGDTWGAQAEKARRAGKLEQALEAYKKAEQAYQRAATIGQSDTAPYLRFCSMAEDHLRLIMYGSGNNPEPVFQSGRSACTKAIAINPQSAAPRAALANLVLAHAQISEDGGENPLPIYTRVIDNARRAIQLDPEYSLSYFVAGTGYQRIAIYQLNHTDENPTEALAQAAGYYEQALAVDKTRDDVDNELANVYSIRGEYIALHSDNDPMPDLLAAVEHYKTGIEINPDKLIIQTNLAFNYTIIADYFIKSGQDPVTWFGKAFDIYQDVLERNPNLLLARINLAATAIHRGNYARQRGEDPLPWWQQAITQADKILAADPENYDAWISLSEVCAHKAEYLQNAGTNPVAAAQKAIEASRKANGIRETADTWYQQGVALLALARSDADNQTQRATWKKQAQEAMQHALTLEPDHEKATEALGLIQSG